jgi:hypothetical protein
VQSTPPTQTSPLSRRHLSRGWAPAQPTSSRPTPATSPVKPTRPTSRCGLSGDRRVAMSAVAAVPSLSQLLAWPTEHLTEAADYWEAIGGRCYTVARTLRQIQHPRPVQTGQRLTTCDGMSKTGSEPAELLPCRQPQHLKRKRFPRRRPLPLLQRLLNEIAFIVSQVDRQQLRRTRHRIDPTGVSPSRPPLHPAWRAPHGSRTHRCSCR